MDNFPNDSDRCSWWTEKSSSRSLWLKGISVFQIERKADEPERMTCTTPLPDGSSKPSKLTANMSSVLPTLSWHLPITQAIRPDLTADVPTLTATNLTRSADSLSLTDGKSYPVDDWLIFLVKLLKTKAFCELVVKKKSWLMKVCNLLFIFGCNNQYYSPTLKIKGLHFIVRCNPFWRWILLLKINLFFGL